MAYKYNILELKKDIEMMYGFEVTILKPYFFKIDDGDRILDIYPKNKRCFKITEKKWVNYNDIFELIDKYYNINY